MFDRHFTPRRFGAFVFALIACPAACAPRSGSSDDGVSHAGAAGTSGGTAGASTGGSGNAGAGASGGVAGVTPAGGAAGDAFGSAGASAGTSSGASGTGGAGTSAGGAGATAGNGAAGVPGGAGGVAGSGGSSGTSGAAGSAGGSSDPCSSRPGLLICESFENVAPGALPDDPRWTSTVIGEGTLGADATVAHSGDHSLLVHGVGFQTLLTFHDANILPPAAGRLFVRAFVRLAEPMTGGHNTFIIADTAAAPGQGNAARVGEMAEMLMMTVTGDTHGALSNDDYYTDGLPGVVFPTDTFTCLELLFDSAAQEINTWVEGVEVPDLHRTDWPVDAYDALRFGYEQYAGPASDIWYDDIAIGTEPIGCE